jgi:hypothetical protein
VQFQLDPRILVHTGAYQRIRVADAVVLVTPYGASLGADVGVNLWYTLCAVLIPHSFDVVVTRARAMPLLLNLE